MRVIDPGHNYELARLDVLAPYHEQTLDFVKREGPKYPGNVGHYSGTTLQEVWRACIDRLKYLHNQEPCAENLECLQKLRECIFSLEVRAARRHGRLLTSLSSIDGYIAGIEEQPTCALCLHIGCKGDCREKEPAKEPATGEPPETPPPASHPYPISVVCACIYRPTPQGTGYQLLMDKRSMPGNPDYDGKWQLPGGKIENGESLDAATNREIKEELGVDVRVIYTGATPVMSAEITGRHFILIAIPCVLTTIEQEKLLPKLGYKLDWIKLDHLREDQMIPHDYFLASRVLRQIQMEI